MEKRLKKSRAESSGIDSAEVPSPPRYELWKVARTKSDGQMTSHSTRVIADKIVSKNIHLNNDVMSFMCVVTYY